MRPAKYDDEWLAALFVCFSLERETFNAGKWSCKRLGVNSSTPNFTMRYICRLGLQLDKTYI